MCSRSEEFVGFCLGALHFSYGVFQATLFNHFYFSYQSFLLYQGSHHIQNRFSFSKLRFIHSFDLAWKHELISPFVKSREVLSRGITHPGDRDGWGMDLRPIKIL
jgi:hypothetical protein